MENFARRILVPAIVATTSLVFVGGCRSSGVSAIAGPDSGLVIRTPPPSPISAENALPGSAGYVQVQPSHAHEMEAYSSAQSALPGDEIKLYVSTNTLARYAWRLWRLGGYGGVGGHQVLSGGPLVGKPQPRCPMEVGTGLVACNWPVAFTVQLDKGLLSGLYLFRFTRDDGWDAAVPLVVRASPTARPSDVLVNIPLDTDQAYNAFGGASLYQDDTGSLPGGHAVKVSYDRPFQQEAGAGNLFAQAVLVVRFLEESGYDVSYTTGAALDADPAEFTRHPLFLAAGHDEYWSRAVREGADSSLAVGGNFAFLSANVGYWRTRWEQNHRVLVCFKDQSARDPHFATPDETLRFRDSPLAHPEDQLVGAMYENWQLVNTPFVVTGADDQLFAGTGLVNGDTILGLVGNEYDRVLPSSPADSVKLGVSSVLGAEGTVSIANAIYRNTPSGGFVFAAGSIDWPWALPHGPAADARIARLTRNILNHALHYAPSTAATATAPPPPPLTGQWATRVTTYAGTGTPGFADGPAARAQFDGPQGIALGPDRALWVADHNNFRVRRIDPGAGHEVDTVAGIGQWGALDGPALQAGLGGPTALAFAATGALYIADTGGHCIRRLAMGMLQTWAGHCGAGTGYLDGPGGTALFSRPMGIAVDGDGLLVADTGNNAIRRIAVDSMVTTIAGMPGGGFSDGPAVSARFVDPTDIVPLTRGGFAILDAGNFAIRRLQNGAIDTLLGSGEGLEDGDSTTAQIRAQHGLVHDSGIVYFADTGNLRVRAIAQGGSTVTLAGSGQSALGAVPDGSGETAAFALPAGLAISGNTLYVSDAAAGTIRAVELR